MSKKATIQNVINYTPKWLVDNLDDDKIKTIGININTLRHMASRMTYDSFGSKSFLGVFGDKPFYDYTDLDIRMAIAKALEVDKQESAALVNSVLNVDEICKHNTLFQKNYDIIKSKIAEKIRVIEDYDRSIEKYIRSYTENMLRQSGYKKELSELEELLATQQSNDNINYNIVNAVKEVIDSKEWIYLGSYDSEANVSNRIHINLVNANGKYGTRLYPKGHLFLSVKPIICKHIDTTQKSSTINFGHPIVVLNELGLIVQCRFVLHAFHNDGVGLSNGQSAQHPHISVSGEICWGNAMNAYRKLTSDLKSLEYLKVLTLLRSLLETYSPDNPYIKIQKFSRTNRPDNSKHLNLLSHQCMELLPSNFINSVFTQEQLVEINNNYAREKELSSIVSFETSKFNIRWTDIENDFLNDIDRIETKVTALYAKYTDLSNIDVWFSVTDHLDQLDWSKLDGVCLRDTSKYFHWFIFYAAYQYFLTTGKNIVYFIKEKDMYNSCNIFTFEDKHKGFFIARSSIYADRVRLIDENDMSSRITDYKYVRLINK